MGKHLEPEQKTFIEHMFRKGYSTVEVARMANVSEATALCYKPQEMRRRYHHMTTKDLNTIFDMSRDGHTVKQISAVIGCDYRYLLKLRRKMRQGECNG